MTDAFFIDDAPSQAPHRFALIRRILVLRRPLALAGAAIALIGLGLNLAGDAGVSDRPATHPVTAALCIVLGLALASFRYHRPTPLYRYALGFSGALISGERMLNGLFQGVPVLTPWLEAWLYRPLSSLASGQVGPDTAMLLFFLYCSVLARRRFGRIGLAFALAALAVFINDFVAISYGLRLFGGHMSLLSFLALMPLVGGVLLLFIHRPFFRTVLMKGHVGRRTRVSAACAFVIPWMAGLVTIGLAGADRNMAAVQPVMISMIIWALLLTTQFTGVVQHGTDQRRRRVERQLSFLALHDPLTQVLNRRGMAERLDEAWIRFRETGRSAGVILLDLDHFKAINDRYGHDAGDAVLVRVGAAVGEILRQGDAVGRWGGEEFLVLVDGAKDHDALVAVCERLRRAVEDLGPVHGSPEETERFPVSASFGSSWFAEGDARFEDAVCRADSALYRAKQAGRNRTVVFEELRQAG